MRLLLQNVKGLTFFGTHGITANLERAQSGGLGAVDRAHLVVFDDVDIVGGQLVLEHVLNVVDVARVRHAVRLTRHLGRRHTSNHLRLGPFTTNRHSHPPTYTRQPSRQRAGLTCRRARVQKAQPRCCRETVLGKLFAPIVPLFTEQ